mmetsp:Transcript_18273/g.69180  ORF Transcript_18273/g.69180 Transcript_18273/m.69180 type:complete len:265 (-) Transcript_18273:460-1254(-)
MRRPRPASRPKPGGPADAPAAAAADAPAAAPAAPRPAGNLAGLSQLSPSSPSTWRARSPSSHWAASVALPRPAARGRDVVEPPPAGVSSLERPNLEPGCESDCPAGVVAGSSPCLDALALASFSRLLVAQRRTPDRLLTARATPEIRLDTLRHSVAPSRRPAPPSSSGVAPPSAGPGCALASSPEPSAAAAAPAPSHRAATPPAPVGAAAGSSCPSGRSAASGPGSRGGSMNLTERRMHAPIATDILAALIRERHTSISSRHHA